MDSIIAPDAAQTGGCIHCASIQRSPAGFEICAPDIAYEGHVRTIGITASINHVAETTEVVVGNRDVTVWGTAGSTAVCL